MTEPMDIIKRVIPGAATLESELDRAEAEIKRLRAALEHIAIVCTDNMDASCNHRMALDFVRQIANDTPQTIG